ncbi:box C/D snoRNA protein 1-like [Patiria miniata]|uniref:HIT-type domain-containing protein n=1 Tax=Patiria miniata TaxID=46514 RepID=A0A914AIN6_PATMI|nr:box C/D snoRNA protein 1-like [Patiria miniata]
MLLEQPRCKMSCEVCEQVQPKYKCPGCNVKTCSLHCVKKHKTARGCNGVRDKTTYVSIKGFTDQHLLSDYRFLEDVDRKAYSAITDDIAKQTQYKPKYYQLRKFCQTRKTFLKLLPPSFSRHKENTSWVSKREKVINWRVHWKFPQSDAEYIDKSVCEDRTLCDILATHLDPGKGDPVQRQRLKKYCRPGVNNLRLFMKEEGRPVNSLRYHRLNLGTTLRHNLSCKTIIEFPVIFVVLKEFADSYEMPVQVQSTSLVAQQESCPQPSSECIPEQATEDTPAHCSNERDAAIDTSVELHNGKVTEMTPDPGTEHSEDSKPPTEREPVPLEQQVE